MVRSSPTLPTWCHPGTTPARGRVRASRGLKSRNRVDAGGGSTAARCTLLVANKCALYCMAVTVLVKVATAELGRCRPVVVPPGAGCGTCYGRLPLSLVCICKEARLRYVEPELAMGDII